MSGQDENPADSTLKPGQQIIAPGTSQKTSRTYPSKRATKNSKTGKSKRTNLVATSRKLLIRQREDELAEKLRQREQREAHDVYVRQEVAAVKAKDIQRAIQPDDIARIRTSLFNIVVTETERARLFLEGKADWNGNQVRLYGMLLNKVLPDLSQKFSEVKIEHTNVKELSREQLEAIIIDSEKSTNEGDNQ